MDDTQGKGNEFQLSEEDKAIFHDFITESLEALDEIEPLLLELEETSESVSQVNLEIINKIFRVFHSIKGSASFLGLNFTSELTHHAENLLDNIRRNQIPFLQEHIDILLKLCDFFRELFEHLQQTYSEAGVINKGYDLIKQLRQMIQTGLSENTETALPTIEQVSDSSSELKESAEQMEYPDDDFNKEMARQFVQDASDLLNELESSILELEKEPGNATHIENVFRLFHNLKGNSGFLGYLDIQEICHKAETFLDKIRNGNIQTSAEQISFLTDIVDFLRSAVENLKQGGDGSIPGKDGIISFINDFLLSDTGSNPDAHDAELEQSEKPSAVQGHRNETKDHSTSQKEEVPLSTDLNSSVNKSEDQTSSITSYFTSQLKQAEEVIRVDVGKLNALMDLVGEIVIAESMVSQHPEISGYDLPGFEKAITHLQKNIRELQELATSMRMIPIIGLFRKMNRLVRDLSKKSGKKIELKIHGGETEIDRSVIEHISDPLVHIIRNAVDHGIESAAERKAKGKPEIAEISLEAKQIGGEIQIRVSDDGRGLNREKIIQKAIEKKLISAQQNDLTDDEVWHLIFLPGFSTADKVTDISGRGVGMDVVVRNIEKIRGRVEIKSEKDRGTTVILRIPLTTAIIDGMITRVGNSLYAIPMLDIRESMVVRPEQIVTLMDGQEVVKIREQLFPVVRLNEFHNIPTPTRALSEGILIMVENTNRPICIFVDEIIGQKQLVIKPIPDYLGHIEAVSGCAILGNGEICLILDVATIIKNSEKDLSNQEYHYAG